MPNLTNNGLASIFLDGKQVKKASLGGKIFFEKHDYDLSVTSDKQILSHYDNDSCTITAMLTDYDEPISDETVMFSCNSPLLETYIVDSTSYEPVERLFTSGKYYFSYEGSTEARLAIINNNLDTRNEILIVLSPTDARIHIIRNGASTLIQTDTNEIIFVNNSLTYTVNGNEETLDCSYIGAEMIRVNIDDGLTVKYYTLFRTTDSYGEASVYYDSKGTGDINITVDCMNLQETYSLEDYDFYDSCLSDKTSNYSYQNIQYEITHSISSTENGYSIMYNGGIYRLYKTNFNLPLNCVIECDFYHTGGGIGVGISDNLNCDLIGCWNTDMDHQRYTNNSWIYAGYSSVSASQSMTNTWVHLKVTRIGTQITYEASINGSVIGTLTKTSQFSDTSQTLYMGIAGKNTTGGLIKNIKVKAL